MDSDRLPQSEEQPAAGWHWVRPVALVALGVAVAVGVWARFSGLGLSSLATDEYYFVRSIRRILETGLPGFDSGGYYTRALLVQYLTAPFVWLSGGEEFGVRVPSALLGLGSAFLAYLYGRRTIGGAWGLVLAALLLLSSWEVEFSRFGRMYAGFQFVTLALLIALHDVIEGLDGWRRYLPPLLGLAAVGTHALSLVMLPLLFVPLLLPGRLERLGGRGGAVRYSLLALVPCAVGAVLQIVDFRRLGVENATPPDFVWSADSAVVYPAFPFWDLGSASVELAVVAAILALAVLGGWWLVRRGRIDEPAAVAGIGIAAALTHSLLLAGFLLLVLVVRYRLPRSSGKHPLALRLSIAAGGVAGAWIAYAGWLTFGAGSRGWIESSGVGLFREAVRRAFVWPDPGVSVIQPWLAELPVLAWLFGVTFVIQFVLVAREPLPRIIRNPAFFVAYLFAVLGVVAPTFSVTRYTYFAYPIALAMLALTVRDLVRLALPRLGLSWPETLVAVPVVLAMFAVGGDFHPRHLAAVASYESTYRTGDYRQYATTWYNRDDNAATGEYVAEAAGPSDLVVVAEVPAVSHYLARAHSVYLDRRSTRFVNVSRDGGTSDLWSGQRLLSTPAELREATRCADGPVWLVQSNREGRWFEESEIWGDLLENAAVAFTNPDGSQDVTRVTLRRDPTCPGVAGG